MRKKINPADLRVVAYPSDELLDMLDDFCKKEGFDRNGGIKYILRVMLDVQDDSTDSVLSECISILEEYVRRIQSNEEVSNDIRQLVAY